jgi:hypothetical protein
VRFVAAGLVCLGLTAGFALPIPSAFAQQIQSWNGEWAGNWLNGSGAQIIFAGNELIGVYWRGDYLSQTHAALSRGGATVAIDWASGGAVITRDGPTTAHIVVHESGRPETSFVLTKDH